MKDKSKLVAVILVIITILVLVINYFFKPNQNKEETFVVTNASNFYTVNSCLYRTINYISLNDYESLFLLLPEEYKEKNNITKDSIKDIFPKVNAGSTFVSEKMYYVNLSKNLTKYFVKGNIEENKIYDGEVLNKKENNYNYFIVYLDSKNSIFSVEPYDGEIFNEEGLNEK